MNALRCDPLKFLPKSKKVIDVHTTEFTCPKCSSSHFGTTAKALTDNTVTLNNLIGYCRGCGFSWDRAEGWKYFN